MNSQERDSWLILLGIPAAGLLAYFFGKSLISTAQAASKTVPPPNGGVVDYAPAEEPANDLPSDVAPTPYSTEDGGFWGITPPPGPDESPVPYADLD